VTGSTERPGGGAEVRARRPRGDRPHSFRVRLSSEELAVMREAAGADGMAVGAWLVHVAMSAAGQRIDPEREAEARERLGHLDAVRRDIHRPGANLNQIARAYNSGEPVALSFADAVMAEHLEVLATLRQLMADYRRWLGRR